VYNKYTVKQLALETPSLPNASSSKNQWHALCRLRLSAASSKATNNLPYRYTKKKKRRTKGEKRESIFFFWLGPFFLNKLFFTCSKTSLAVNLFPFLLTVSSTTLHYRVRADHLHDGSPAERALATAAHQLICTFRASTHVPTPAIVTRKV
jgi:hypothetical protein